MVYEPPVAAHSMSVDHEAAVQMQTVMMGVVHVDAVHALLELLIRNHFAHVFQEKFSLFDGFFGANAPAFIFSHKFLNPRCPVVFLNALVIASMRSGTFGQDQPVDAIVLAIRCGFAVARLRFTRATVRFHVVNVCADFPKKEKTLKPHSIIWEIVIVNNL